MSDYLSFRLPDSFVAPYVDRTPNWGFPIGGGNYLGEITYVNKYSALKEDGTKERWHETVRRCVEGYYSILKDHCQHNRTPWNDYKALQSAKDAYERMFTFKWLPPGRGLQHMGRPALHLAQDSSRLQNCFSGSEEVLTTEGPKALVEVAGTEVVLWTTEGWSPALIQEFGEQRVQRVSFKPLGLRSMVVRDVVVTADHRWILENGEETTSLAVGDRVSGSVPAFDEDSDDYFDGVLHGLVFGDGGKTSYRYIDGRYGYELRCCDSRTQDLAASPRLKDKWDKIYKERQSAGTDWFYFLKSDKELKDFPSGQNTDYLHGFVNGWIAADANLTQSGSYILSSQNPQSLSWLLKYAASAGYQLVGHNQITTPTNFGERKNPLYRLTLRDAESPISWRVVAISEMADTSVYCPLVPSTGSFVLASGINTGNCSFVSTAKLSAHSAWEATRPFVLMMEMSMNGIGVGFDTRGAGRLTIHQPDIDRIETFVVPDTREGWAEAVGKLLESYFFKNRPTVSFNYDQVRPSGSPLKSFGGRSSGPGPLMVALEFIRTQLDNREGELITSRDILDIMNKIGKAVVAGGARRSAQICFGDPDDSDYVTIKDFRRPENASRLDPEHGWGWLSNNSVFVKPGSPNHQLVEATRLNGEPGYMWLELAQQYGRMADPRNDKDYRVMGGNPCLEQSLEDGELCTLVESFPMNHVDFADYRETLKHAYLYGKAVTLMPTSWPESNEVMARNRRIGCSMSGLAEFVDQRGWAELRTWMDEGYQFIQHRDRKYSEWLAVRESIKMTSVKPSGTVSLLVGATPGVHWPVASGLYLRRVRYTWNDPMLTKLVDAGYPVEPAVGDPENTAVVTFVAQGPKIRNEREVSIWEKAELAVMAQRWWADNQVSATVTFKSDEGDQIMPLLASKEGQLKGISFLPIDEAVYDQAPYEAVDEEVATGLLEAVSHLGDLYASGSEASGDRFCENDKCLIGV